MIKEQPGVRVLELPQRPLDDPVFRVALRPLGILVRGYAEEQDGRDSQCRSFPRLRRKEVNRNLEDPRAWRQLDFARSFPA